MANSAEYKLAIQIAGSLAGSFTSSVGQAQSRLSALGAAAGTVLKATAAAAAAAGAALGAFAASSVKTGMEFDSAMSQVAATMGTTTDNVQDLRDFAQQMGASTAFSATEAAEALNYMALAGYGAEQSMEMLPKVLSLAAAGGIDLASASDMVTDAQSALGLTAGETAAMVDQMAKASSKTNTSVAQLGEALLTIGATGQTAAGGTQELNQVLGILADNGIKGSEGGTHLRNVMLSLQAPTSAAAKALEALGVSAFDSQGSFRDMQDIFLDLQGSLDGLSEQERADVLSTMFNKTDLAAVNALLGTSAERWDEVAAALAGCEGAAGAMAATQLDNLAGDITLFQSALEGAQIAVSDQLTPSLREFVQFGSKGISELTTAFQEGGLDGAMEALGGLLSEGLGMVLEQVPGFMEAGAKLLGALGRGLLDNLPAILGVGADLAGMLLDGIMTGLPLLAQGAVQIMSDLGQYLQENLPALLQAGLQAVSELSGSIRENAGLLVDGAIGLAMSLAQGLADSIPAIVQNVPTIVSNIAGVINDNAPKLLAAAAGIIWTLAKGLVQAIPTIIQNIPQIIGAIVDVFTAFNWMNLGKTILTSLGSGIKSLIGSISATAKTIVHDFQTIIAGLPGYLLALGGDIVTGLWNGVTGAAGWLLGNVQSFCLSILNGIGSFLGLSSLAEIGGNVVMGLYMGISGVWSTLTEFLAAAIENVKTLFSGILDFIGNVFAGNWSAAWQNIQDIFGNLFGGIVNLAKIPINGVISAINSVLEKINGISVTIPDWVPGVGGQTLGFNLPTIPQLAQGGIVTAPTLLEAGEAGDEAIIPLPELWEKVQGLMAGTLDGAASRLADALALGNGGDRSWSGPLDWDGDAPAENGYSQPPLVIYYQPHLHFEGGAPSRDDIVEAGRISQEEFNRMAAKWQKDAARLSLRG